jgi:signal transduction histidine kinase
MGLVQATKSLVEGFGRRAGLRASFELLGLAAPLEQAADAALYRIVQEGLANVHRHSKASSVRVALIFRRFAAHVLIADDGVGAARERFTGTEGVGLSSMNSRLNDIGGRMSVWRLNPGTAVVASVPLPSPKRSA